MTTSSSAVAKRRRDASCLSVVGFNSTKRRTESFIVSYICYRFVTACNYMVFCCLWRNVETFCHKHFAVLSRHQQTSPLTTSEVSQLMDGGPTASYWQHLAGSSINSTHWSQILAQNHNFCLPHLHLTPSLGGGVRRNRNTRMMWYPMVKDRRYLYSFWQNVRTWQTDRWTPHDGIGRACKASRGNN